MEGCDFLMALDVSELVVAVGGEPPEPDMTQVERMRMDKSLEIPKELTDVELWTNFTNDELYEMDKHVRAYIKETQWVREKNGGSKTTASLVFAYIFGRQPEPKDGSSMKVLHRLLEYYCSSYTGTTSINGKRVNRVYKFKKYVRGNKRPMSLRLRLEESDKYGKLGLWSKGPDERRDKREVRRRNRKDGDGEDGRGGEDS